jgi:hypothetical protein
LFWTSYKKDGLLLDRLLGVKFNSVLIFIGWFQKGLFFLVIMSITPFAPSSPYLSRAFSLSKRSCFQLN